MRFTILAILILLSVSTKMVAQNLIADHGFDVHNCKPFNLSSIEMCEQWTNPTAGTPDYFNPNCKQHSSPIMPNFYDWGWATNKAANDAYAGIIVFRADKNLKRKEYIQTKLLSSLKKDSVYLLQIDLLLASWSKFNLKELGIHFSSKQKYSNTQENFDLNPQIILQTGSVNSEIWTTIEIKYKATGDEQYLTIGNFNKKPIYNSVPFRSEINLKTPECYYYIDNFNLIANEKKEPLIDNDEFNKRGKTK